MYITKKETSCISLTLVGGAPTGRASMSDSVNFSIVIGEVQVNLSEIHLIRILNTEAPRIYCGTLLNAQTLFIKQDL